MKHSKSKIHVHFPSVSLPQGDGSFVVRPGKPFVRAEVSTSDFAKISGLSQRRVRELCGEGRLRYRRPGGARGKIFIYQSELAKALTYQGAELENLESKQK